FFFFQAEDGIRDRTVTGVQTCALPISVRDLAPVCHGSGIRSGPPENLRGRVDGPGERDGGGSRTEQERSGADGREAGARAGREFMRLIVNRESLIVKPAISSRASYV